MLYTFIPQYYEVIKKILKEEPGSEVSLKIQALYSRDPLLDFEVEKFLFNSEIRQLINFEPIIAGDIEKAKIFIANFPYFEVFNLNKGELNFLTRQAFNQYEQRLVQEFNFVQTSNNFLQEVFQNSIIGDSFLSTPAESRPELNQVAAESLRGNITANPEPPVSVDNNFSVNSEALPNPANDSEPQQQTGVDSDLEQSPDEMITKAYLNQEVGLGLKVNDKVTELDYKYTEPNLEQIQSGQNPLEMFSNIQQNKANLKQQEQERKEKLEKRNVLQPNPLAQPKNKKRSKPQRPSQSATMMQSALKKVLFGTFAAGAGTTGAATLFQIILS
jgi:hypothetical protein